MPDDQNDNDGQAVVSPPRPAFPQQQPPRLMPGLREARPQLVLTGLQVLLLYPSAAFRLLAVLLPASHAVDDAMSHDESSANERSVGGAKAIQHALPAW